MPTKDPWARVGGGPPSGVPELSARPHHVEIDGILISHDHGHPRPGPGESRSRAVNLVAGIPAERPHARYPVRPTPGVPHGAVGSDDVEIDDVRRPCHRRQAGPGPGKPWSGAGNRIALVPAERPRARHAVRPTASVPD